MQETKIRKQKVKKRNIKPIIINISILLVVFILFIILGEIVFRVIGICNLAPKRQGNLLFFFEEVNSELTYQLKPNTEGYLLGKEVIINSYGLRDYEYALQKQEGTYRIIIIGDSITFGFGVELEESYPKILEEKLKNELNMNIEVINFGVPGYTGIQEFIVLEEQAIKYFPDLIIIGHYLNDPDEVWDIFEATPTSKIPPKIKIFLNENSCSYDFFKERWSRLLNKIGKTNFKSYKELYIEDSELWDAHKERFIDMKEISDTEGIPILVVLFPNWRNLNESYDFKEETLLLIETINKSELNSLDIYSKIKGLNGEEYTISLTDASHPNYEGNKIVSNLIYEELIKSDYFPNKQLINEKYFIKQNG